MHIVVYFVTSIAIFISILGWDPGFIRFWVYPTSLVLMIITLLLALFQRISGKRFILCVLGIFFFFLVGLTHWPLKFAFRIAQPQLISMSLNNSLDEPPFVFFFDVVEVEKRDKGVIYWLDRDPDGTALVFGDGVSESLNEWVRVKVAENWFYIILD